MNSVVHHGGVHKSIQRLNMFDMRYMFFLEAEGFAVVPWLPDQTPGW